MNICSSKQTHIEITHTHIICVYTSLYKKNVTTVCGGLYNMFSRKNLQQNGWSSALFSLFLLGYQSAQHLLEFSERIIVFVGRKISYSE